MRPGRGLHRTTRVGGISGEWAVVQQEEEAEGKQTYRELGCNSEAIAVA
jgi:hypothetical protein